MKTIDENGAAYAWFVVALLIPVALLNYLDRQMLAAMKFSVMADIPDSVDQHQGEPDHPSRRHHRGQARGVGRPHRRL
jgi:hypothetical protein